LCWREPGRKRCKSAQRRSVSTRTRSKGRELARDLESGSTGKFLGFLDLIAPSPTSPTPLRAREKRSHLLQRIFFGNTRRSHDRPRWCLIKAISSTLRLCLQIFNNLLELADRFLQGGSRDHLLSSCLSTNLRGELPPLLFIERRRELSKQLPTLVEKTQIFYLVKEFALFEGTQAKSLKNCTTTNTSFKFKHTSGSSYLIL